jgi:hypothetical protein
MNKNGVLLDMSRDTIVFSSQLDSLISVLPVPYTSKELPSINVSRASKVLQRPVSTSEEEVCSIYSIGVAAFQTLANRSKKNHTEVFAMSVEDIDREIAYYTQCNLDSVSLSSIDETAQNLEDIKAKLPPKYQEFLV